MIETAQNVADRYGLTHEEIDAFALRSHHHAAQARDTGRLAKEIVPVTIPATRRSAERLFEHDETIRDDTTLGSLAKLSAQPGHDADDRGQLDTVVGWIERRSHRQR